MTPDDILNETEAQTSQRERVERLDAMRKAGERSDERIATALATLQREVQESCDRALKRIDNARRDRDNLSHVLPLLKRERKVWAVMRHGYSRATALQVYELTQQAELKGLHARLADGDAEVQEALRKLQAPSLDDVSRACTRRNAQYAIDSLRSIANRIST